MQYILSQEEYDALRQEQRAQLRGKKKELQKLATDAANHIPVVPHWAPKHTQPEPWGCILNTDADRNPGYCDACPAEIVCPHDDKEFSQ